VISGFLITSIICKDIERDQFSIREFYVRRARRILPALTAVLIVSGVFAVLCLLPGQFRDFLKSALSSLVFASNIYFWQTINYFSPSAEETPLLHLWSLGVEEQYYILFPLLLAAVARFKKSALVPILVALIVLSLGFAEIERRIDPAANFYLLPSRAWELLVGALLSRMPLEAWQQRPFGMRTASALSLLGLVLIISSVLLFTGATPSPSVFAIAPVAGAALVIGCANSRNICGKLLALWPLRWAGLVSYSAYLWHQPIIAYVRLQSIFEPGPWIKPVEVVATFLLAYLSWRYIEQRFRRSKPARAPLTAYAVTLAGMAGVAAALLVAVQFTPSFLPTYTRGVQVAGQEVVTYADEGVRLSNCIGKLQAGLHIKTCHIGVLGKPDDLVLWGDSYAAALSNGLDRAARARGLSGTAYFQAGCPPIVGLRRRSEPACTTQTHRLILDQILKDAGHPVVLLYGNIAAADHDSGIEIWGRATSPSEAVGSLTDTRNQLNAAGKQFAIVEQGPRFDQPIADYYLHDRLRARSDELSIPIVDRVFQEKTLFRYAQTANIYIKTTDFFCKPASCAARDSSGRIMFRDNDHLTDFYSEKFADFVLDRLPAKKQWTRRPA